MYVCLYVCMRVFMYIQTHTDRHKQSLTLRYANSIYT